MAGDGRVSDLKRVIFHAADGRAFDVQFERTPCHALVQDNKLSHRLFNWDYDKGNVQVKLKSP
jgi:hypothetical protein